jgi:hypothetical protein
LAIPISLLQVRALKISPLCLNLFSKVSVIDSLYLYCHMFVTRHGVWIDNWIYWRPITYNYK